MRNIGVIYEDSMVIPLYEQSLRLLQLKRSHVRAQTMPLIDTLLLEGKNNNAIQQHSRKKTGKIPRSVTKLFKVKKSEWIK